MTTAWKLDKHIPVAVILAMGLQTAGIIWWASSLTERVVVLEAKAASTSGLVTDVAVIKDRIETLKSVSSRIEDKIDNLSGGKQ